MSNETDRRELFEQCIETCADSMYRVAYRLTGDSTLATDLVQETSLAAWKSLDSLRDPARIRSWMFSILRNQYSKLVRQEKRTPTAIETIEDMPENESQDKQELQQTVQLSISQLPEKHRMPLLLVSMEGFSVDEAAEILQIPRGTVLSRLSRARDKLKLILKQQGIGSNSFS